jgi:hypothetical protein
VGLSIDPLVNNARQWHCRPSSDLRSQKRGP